VEYKAENAPGKGKSRIRRLSLRGQLSGNKKAAPRAAFLIIDSADLPVADRKLS